jgi:hypothetical protein
MNNPAYNGNEGARRKNDKSGQNNEELLSNNDGLELLNKDEACLLLKLSNDGKINIGEFNSHFARMIGYTSGKLKSIGIKGIFNSQ